MSDSFMFQFSLPNSGVLARTFGWALPSSLWRCCLTSRSWKSFWADGGSGKLVFDFFGYVVAICDSAPHVDEMAYIFKHFVSTSQVFGDVVWEHCLHILALMIKTVFAAAAMTVQRSFRTALKSFSSRQITSAKSRSEVVMSSSWMMKRRSWVASLRAQSLAMTKESGYSIEP